MYGKALRLPSQGKGEKEGGSEGNASRKGAKAQLSGSILSFRAMAPLREDHGTGDSNVRNPLGPLA
jgi:hypothetical protein